MEQPQRHGDTELHEINKVTERIIGCAIEVHRVLRCGLFESLYRSALAIEFDAVGLTYQREVMLPAMYKGRLLGHYRVDFIVADLVIVEVKSVERMNPIFETQVLTYLRLSKKRVGLLINFNSRLLAHGVLDAGNGQAGAGLGGFDPVGQPVQRERDAPQFVRPDRRRVARHEALWGFEHRAGPAAEMRLRGDFLRHVVLEDDPVEPFAERHSRTAGKLLGDLTGLRVDPFDAPGRPHSNRSPNYSEASHRSLRCKREVNATCSDASS